MCSMCISVLNNINSRIVVILGICTGCSSSAPIYSYTYYSYIVLPFWYLSMYIVRYIHKTQTTLLLFFGYYADGGIKQAQKLLLYPS